MPVNEDGIDESKYPPNNGETKQPKKVEKVVKSTVSRKRNRSKQFLGMFISEDAESVGSYILLDLIIPAIKSMAYDIVSQGTERLLFGGKRAPNRGTGARPTNYTNYTKISKVRNDDYTPGERYLSRRARANHEFDEIIIESRDEAELVLDRLHTLIDTYEQATVSDLYDLVGITADYTDDNWGWYDIRRATITRVREGYRLDMPRPVVLK